MGTGWSEDTKYQLCRINMFWRSDIGHNGYGQYYCIACSKFAKGVDLKCSLREQYKVCHRPVYKQCKVTD